MVDVETERKAPAPGLKEKDEEEKSGIGIRGVGEEGALDRGCTRQAGLWRHEREGVGEQRAEVRGSRTPNVCRHGKEWHLPECPGKEEEKVKKGPECREPRF